MSAEPDVWLNVRTPCFPYSASCVPQVEASVPERNARQAKTMMTKAVIRMLFDIVWTQDRVVCESVHPVAAAGLLS